MKPPSRSSIFPVNVDSATLDEAWKGIGSRRIRARRVRRAWMATPIVAALALVLLLVFRHTPPSPGGEHDATGQQLQVIALATGAALPSTWSSGSPQVIAFDDGSRLELGPAARMRLTPTTGVQRDPSRVDLVLEGGTATFDVKPGGPRAWIIEAGETRVRVLGTRFTVVRDGGHVHVSVARGKVRVESARLKGGLQDLLPGQEVDVGVGGGLTENERPASAAETPVMRVENLADAPPPSMPSASAWRPSAHTPSVTTTASMHSIPVTDSTATVPAPEASANKTSSAPTTSDRMTQADSARSAGRPRDAVVILTGIVDNKEPRSALAAFTIGKIQAEELGDQVSAASWFDRAIRLGLPVGLAEDAHARVVECHARAGRIDDAARAASLYEAKFPTGRHLARVRRWKKE